MSKNYRDEIWVSVDGREIPVNELTEYEAKEALRTLIKMDREERTYFDTHIMPAINAMNINMHSLADKMEAEMGISKQTDLADIDAMFDKAGKDWNGNKD